MPEKKINYVYITTNLINGKQYVGSHATDNIDDGYIGSGIYFIRSVKKYGKENFQKEILEECINILEARKLEEKYIFKYGTLSPNGYNLVPKGGLGFNDAILSEEIKEKISRSNRGKKHKISEESRQKMRQSKKGKSLSIDHKEKISKTFQRNGSKKKEKHHMWGKKLSDSHIKALHEGRRGMTLSEDQKNNLSEKAKKRAPTYGNLKPISPELLKTILHRHTIEKKPCSRIAKEIGFHKDRVKRILIKNKVYTTYNQILKSQVI
jgi:hypothetical protein